MHCLGWTDAEQDTQHFRTAHPLSERWVETGAALFDEREVKSGRESDGFDVVHCGWVADQVTVLVDGDASRISVRPGDRRPIVNVNCLGKHEVGIEIRIL